MVKTYSDRGWTVGASRFLLGAALFCLSALASAQSPMTTVLGKSSTANADIAKVLAQCSAPKLPLKLTSNISLVSSKVMSDRWDGVEVQLRSYRFTRTLDKVLPELEKAGVVLKLDPPLSKSVGSVWHGYNEMDGIEATRELICIRVVRPSPRK